MWAAAIDGAASEEYLVVCPVGDLVGPRGAGRVWIGTAQSGSGPPAHHCESCDPYNSSRARLLRRPSSPRPLPTAHPAARRRPPAGLHAAAGVVGSDAMPMRQRQCMSWRPRPGRRHDARLLEPRHAPGAWGGGKSPRFQRPPDHRFGCRGSQAPLHPAPRIDGRDFMALKNVGDCFQPLGRRGCCQPNQPNLFAIAAFPPVPSSDLFPPPLRERDFHHLPCPMDSSSSSSIVDS